LYNARVKIAQGENLKKIKLLSSDYVSDEENGTAENRGNWLIRPPAWRSTKATALMQNLQQGLTSRRDDDVRARVPRILGPLSERSRPRTPVSWAVKNSTQEVESMEEECERQTTPQHTQSLPSKPKSPQKKRKKNQTSRRLRALANNN
jgi:hypothetical protein